MELDHEFTVAADADTAWPVLLDVERMHPLMPGVLYESGADGEYRGRLRLKFGPTTITYRGTARIAVLDDLTRTAILEVAAREARGPGTVTGSFQATVHPASGEARVTLHTRLSFDGGRAASLGEHLVHDTGAKLLARFAANLNAALLAPAEPAARPEPEAVPAEVEPPAVGAALPEIEPTAPAPVAQAEPVRTEAAPEPDPLIAEPALPEPAHAEPEPAAQAEAETAPAETVAVEALLAEPPAQRITAQAPRPRPLPSAAEDKLDLYELTDRPALLRRLLPVVGVVLLVVLLRRLARRR